MRLDFTPRFDTHVNWMNETFARVKWKPPAESKEAVTGQAVYLYNADDACVLPRVGLSIELWQHEWDGSTPFHIPRQLSIISIGERLTIRTSMMPLTAWMSR